MGLARIIVLGFAYFHDFIEDDPFKGLGLLTKIVLPIKTNKLKENAGNHEYFSASSSKDQPSPLRMHYLEFPAAVVDWSVAAEEDALEGLPELRAENCVDDLKKKKYIYIKIMQYMD